MGTVHRKTWTDRIDETAELTATTEPTSSNAYPMPAAASGYCAPAPVLYNCLIGSWTQPNRITVGNSFRNSKTSVNAPAMPSTTASP